MSALPPKADIAGRQLDVRFVPKATAPQKWRFDHSAMEAANSRGPEYRIRSSSRAGRGRLIGGTVKPCETRTAPSLAMPPVLPRGLHDQLPRNVVAACTASISLIVVALTIWISEVSAGSIAFEDTDST